MRSAFLLVIVIFATACASEGFDVATASAPEKSDAGSSNDGGAPPDATPNVRESGGDDAPDTRCAQNGAAACDDYVGAYCERLFECCVDVDGTCSPSCMGVDGDDCTVDDCRAWSVKNGFDCASSRYSSVTVCEETTQKCTDDLPLMACSDLLAGTANLPASCDTFLNQF